eukprot:2109220-Alexandrium_andersonii.AAC.1
MRSCLRCSKPELLGPRSGLKCCLRSSRGVCSEPFFAQMPNVPTKWAGGHATTLVGGVSGGEPPGKTYD